jgi:hypothetical protein
VRLLLLSWKKLIYQMTIGGHHLDAVEACTLRVDGGATVLLEDNSDLRRLQRSMR